MSHDPDRSQLKELREAVRQRLTMAELCAKDGLEGRREGSALRAKCPFHDEKSASFVIGGRSKDTAHCFGCGWHGDQFRYWADRRGLDNDQDHLEVVNQLASLVGLAPLIEGVQWARPQAKHLVPVKGEKRIEAGLKPALPRMRALRDDELVSLAQWRGLSVEAITLAARTFRRIGFSEWPLHLSLRDRRWTSPCQAHWFKCRMDTAECSPRPRWPSWCVTDDARWVAQFRRLDGDLYPAKDKEGFKTYTEGTAKWPVGAAEIGHRPCVIVVEGGPDMLAAYHFLHHYGRLRDVAVVTVLGASVIIAEEALPYFAGKRVRIIAQNDPVKVKKTKRADGTEGVIETCAGLDAAARWQEQFTGAGAVVETFALGPLVSIFGSQAHLAEGLVAPCAANKVGEPLNDLNELAMLPRVVWESEFVRDAFCEWKEGFGG
jgi:hypothetical protein